MRAERFHYELSSCGSLEEAVELLLEVVRLAPNAADPYRTLGNIYEVKGDPRKALHFFMIAAHLPPKVLPRLRTGCPECAVPSACRLPMR